MVPKETVVAETERLLSDNFAMVSKSGRLQRLNGWMPLQKRLVAVELKLRRVEEALLQAENNLGFADESFVALPKELATRVAGGPRSNDFRESGVGLIGVTRSTCEVLIAPREKETSRNLAAQVYCVEKFWRTSSRGS